MTTDAPARTFNLADLFELVADAVPDRVAVVAGDHRLTFAQLDERGTRLANHLRAQGLEPGAKVAVLSWNRAEWIEALFGCFKARLVPVNVNYRYTAAELRYILDNSDAEAVIFERSFAPLVAEAASGLPLLRHRIVLEDGSDEVAADAVGYEDALAAAPAERLVTDRSPDDLYMLYTGGTTGMPKGVMWRHEDAFFAALLGGSAGTGDPISSPAEIVDRIKPEDQALRSLVLAPVMHGAAQWGLSIALLSGGSVVLSTAHGFDPHEAWRLAEQERVVSVMVVGDAMARPLAEALDDPAHPHDVSSVLAIGSGGAVFSAAVKAQLRSHLPNLFISDSFGSSEMGAAGSQLDPDAGARFPMVDTVAVLGDDLMPLPAGSDQVGRVARRGHIPLGYYKDEAKTAATFVTGPDGVRWAVPGDYGRHEADGTCTLLGRGSGCINTGGEKVYPEEVEAALKSHPGVFDVLVLGVPDERFGERVAAIVEPRPGHTVTLDELSAHSRQVIAGYKAPRELKLVERIGRTPSGKADYRWAKAQFEG